MKASTRVAVNTLAQYSRTIANVLLGLYSTRIILLALGQDDFGLYSLIGGVVAMLSFINGAMLATTQRFMSFHQGASSAAELRRIFSNSLLIHIGLALLAFVVLEITGLFLFDGFLSIAPDRIGAAHVVYHCAVFMVICSLCTSPFQALLISRENLVYTSMVEVLNGVLKVVVAVLLTVSPIDKLIFYAFLMSGISVVTFFAYAIYGTTHYAECGMPRISHLNGKLVRHMFSFAGWSLYSSGCIVGRSQGVAVVINRFFSTAVNAAYGIAFQVNSATSFLSGSVIAAMNPQIMKSEGMGDRQRMLQLASTANKITLLLSCALVVPVACIIEPLLTLWLKEYPPATPLFCRVILITSVFDTLTYGLSSANQAIGRIRNYSLTINSIKLFTVPCLYFALCAGIELSYAIWIYAILELVGAICRIPFLKITAGLNVSKYMRDVHLRVAPSLIFLILAYLALQYFHLSLWLDILFAVIITAAYSWIIYKTALIGYEKEIMSNIFRTIRNKFLHLKIKIQ